MATVIWADQQDIPASDRGLAYGDGVFETIRVQANLPTLRQRHVARLLEGAERLAIPLPTVQLHSVIDEAIERYACPDDWVLKLILTRGSGGRGYRPAAVAAPRLIVSAHPMPPMPPSEGVVACISSHQLLVHPRLAGLKSLARLDQVMASQAMPDECFEALMVNGTGHLLEGTRTNILVLFGNVWLMPVVSTLAVEGTMLGQIVALLRNRGEIVCEQAILPTFITQPEFLGLWLMNSVIGIVPVSQVDGTRLPVNARLATIVGQQLFMD
ncbi:aminotransferase class IV [Marinobacter changyiensis]|uniref:aminotransferase class IV n=1 Tax=Marinobacter changyiensis TaxID=2604091 RepID=UPI001264C4B9|nr:aminotransferase class IV [Marinobacter changyiensis]